DRVRGALFRLRQVDLRVRGTVDDDRGPVLGDTFLDATRVGDVEIASRQRDDVLTAGEERVADVGAGHAAGAGDQPLARKHYFSSGVLGRALLSSLPLRPSRKFEMPSPRP